MKNKSIYDQELERRLISGLLKYPQKYFEIEQFISEKDFYSEDSKFYKTAFSVLSEMIKRGEAIDDVVVATRIKSLGISFEDDISVMDYLAGMFRAQIPEDGVIQVAKDLKKVTMRRECLEDAWEVAKKMRSMPPTASYQDIVEAVDKTWNRRVSNYENFGENEGENIYESMESYIYDLAENPDKNAGLPMPYKLTEKIYGPLLSGGNIFVVCGRSGGSKSTFMMDLATKTSAMSGIPVIHFDNGELSKNELMLRQTAALSGVPIFHLKNGTWRNNKELHDKIVSLWPTIKSLKHYYFNVAGMSLEQMCSLLKRSYYQHVGRGNKAIFLFDYIKSQSVNGRSEWAFIGDLVDAFKKVIHKEIISDGEPMISMLTGAQANRSATVTGKKIEQIEESENAVGLSDRIVQLSSHTAILRVKTDEELANEEFKFGTHTLLFVKCRHLGELWEKHIHPIKTSKGPRKNYINFHIENFCVEEKEDLEAIISSLDGGIIEDSEEENEELPFSLR